MSSGLGFRIGQPLPSRKDTTKVVTELKIYFIRQQNYNFGACAVKRPRGQVDLALLTAHLSTGIVTLDNMETFDDNYVLPNDIWRDAGGMQRDAAVSTLKRKHKNQFLFQKT